MAEPAEEKFFYGRNPNNIIPKFSKKMLRLLRRYRARQYYEIERSYQWSKLERLKPDPNRNHPADDAKIKAAEFNMGDYKLKIGRDFEPQPTDNLNHKYYSIVQCRQEIYLKLKEFNQQVFELREQKKITYEFITSKQKRLMEINNCLPEANRVEIPEIAPIDMDKEYPELNLLEHKVAGCGIEIKDILNLENTVESLLPKPPLPVKHTYLEEDRIHEIYILDAIHINKVHTIPSPDEITQIIEQHPSLTEIEYYEDQNDEEYTSAWLVESRLKMILNLLSEQEYLLYIINAAIEYFDKSVRDLHHKRYHVKFDVEYLECYLITLNQELNILRDSEEIENTLKKNADLALKTRNELQVLILAANRQNDDSRKSVEKYNEQIAQMQIKFLNIIRGHKFFDFLRRIFKKKWRPPKAPKTGDGK